MNKNMLLGVGAVIVIAVLAGGYVMRHKIKAMLMPQAATPTSEAMQQPTVATTPEAMTSPASTSAMAPQELTVTGNEFSFTPNKLMVKMGEPVTITFKNAGKYAHNFTLADLNVQSKTIQPGESDTVTFTPAKAGSFEYQCTVDSHADKGMVGTLTVQ